MKSSTRMLVTQAKWRRKNSPLSKIGRKVQRSAWAKEVAQERKQYAQERLTKKLAKVRRKHGGLKAAMHPDKILPRRAIPKALSVKPKKMKLTKLKVYKPKKMKPKKSNTIANVKAIANLGSTVFKILRG